MEVEGREGREEKGGEERWRGGEERGGEGGEGRGREGGGRGVEGRGGGGEGRGGGVVVEGEESGREGRWRGGSGEGRGRRQGREGSKEVGNRDLRAPFPPLPCVPVCGREWSLLVSHVPVASSR